VLSLAEAADGGIVSRVDSEVKSADAAERDDCSGPQKRAGKSQRCGGR
jgi:hypothetical protein